MRSLYTFKIQKNNVWQLFIMYCCVLLYIVFLTPNRYAGERFTPNLIPLLQTFERIHKPAGEHFWAYYIGYWGNIFGNVILFMPFGFLLKCLYPSANGKQVLLYGLLTSTGIELLQLLLQIGVCDIDDVLLNVCGTAAGLLVYRRIKEKIALILIKAESAPLK